MRIAHISDTHLGYRQYNLDERENDIYDAFNEAVDLMIEERVDVVIHAGDFFDTPRPPIKALYVAKEAIKRLHENGIKILTVLGEHDTPKRRAMPPHRLLDIPILGIGELSVVEIDGVGFFGISNMKGKRVDLLKQELSKVDALANRYSKAVLIAHQGIKKYLPFEGAYELELGDLPKEIDYYAFGHIHRRTFEKFGRGYLAYSGSIEILSRSEINDWKRDGKGIYIVDLEGDLPEVHKISLQQIRPQFELSYSKSDVIEELKAFLYNLLKNPPNKSPILRINISGEGIRKPEILEKVQHLLRKMVPEKVLRYDVHFVGSDTPTTITAEELGKIADLEELFIEYLGDETLGHLAFELYKSLQYEDVEGGIEICKKYLEGRK
ncbi:exonuclease SbcCD subunit D [Thermococcus sp. LS2]|uniref:metallophosphoesterase family protein n=1 Tax=Thermococcus sp. LS2 TaxID=1638260 RepID=UPI00143AB654|nr:exonuclease SbcCD subunit D [Thermococcus sp. LS2]NJE11883.1 exonuclease SbcCD subunit D [Thermococcus sp. LS2]